MKKHTQIGIIFIFLFIFVIIYHISMEKIKINIGDYSILISVNNNLQEDICLIFLPYYSPVRNIKGKNDKIILPPRIKNLTPKYYDIGKIKNNQQYYIIHNGRYTLDLYLGKNIDFEVFYLFVYGFKYKNREENYSLKNINENELVPLATFHNSNYTGNFERDNYEFYGNIDITTDTFKIKMR